MQVHSLWLIDLKDLNHILSSFTSWALVELAFYHIVFELCRKNLDSKLKLLFGRGEGGVIFFNNCFLKFYICISGSFESLKKDNQMSKYMYGNGRREASG